MTSDDESSSMSEMTDVMVSEADAESEANQVQVMVTALLPLADCSGFIQYRAV